MDDIRLVPLSSAPAARQGLVPGGLAAVEATEAAQHDTNAAPLLLAASPSSGQAQLAQALGTLLHEGGEALFHQVESALVHAAFAACGQNQVRTAKVLGITRNMLRTQLKRHGLLTDATALSASLHQVNAAGPR